MKTARVDPSSVDLDFLKQEFNRFRNELSGMKDKLGANASDALDQMNSYLNGNAMASRIASIEAELEHYAGKLKGSGKEAVNRIETEVTQRPIASIAIAFGIGLLASQLLRRS
jgi:ElaB/YqjD/DUF883 family membrane-anchored ribosome-binding protein